MKCSLFNFQEGVCNGKTVCTQVNIGYDYCPTLTVTDESKAIVDLTGADLVMTIYALDGSELLTLSIVGATATLGFYIPDPTSGVVNMQIPAASNTLIAEGSYKYITNLTDSGGKLTVFMQGSIQFLEVND